MAGLILVRNVVGELRPKRTLAASRGFLAGSTAFLFIQSAVSVWVVVTKLPNFGTCLKILWLLIGLSPRTPTVTLFPCIT